MTVEFTFRARRDLAGISDWIARDNPARALTFVEELRGRALALADFPRQCPVYRRSKHGPVRKCVYGDYQIFYVARAESVDVLAIRHGARRPPRFG